MIKNKNIIFLHMAVMLFGLAGVIGKLVSIPAVILTFFRVLFSSVFLLFILGGKKTSLRLDRKKDYLWFAAAGILMAVHWTSFLQSIQISTVAIGTITFSAFPLFVTFLEPLVYGEKLRGRDVAAAAVMFAGVMITVPEFSLENKTTAGILIGLVSALTYAGLCLMNRSFSSRYAGIVICFYEQGIAAVFLLPVFLSRPASLSGYDLLCAVFLGIVCTAIAHSIYVGSLSRVKVRTAGIISGMETVYGILFAFVFLGEAPGMRELAGGTVILGAALYATLEGNRQLRNS